eukprot:2496280-Rhodomonas_salina.1
MPYLDLSDLQSLLLTLHVPDADYGPLSFPKMLEYQARALQPLAKALQNPQALASTYTQYVSGITGGWKKFTDNAVFQKRLVGIDAVSDTLKLLAVEDDLNVDVPY